MELLNRLEENEKLEIHALRMRIFNKEINETYDKNRNAELDKCLKDFIEKYDLEESDITHNLRMFIEYIKNNNNIK